jgi:glycogen debranching enzyme
MREDIEIRNYGDEPSYCSLELLVAVDFADLFAVKEGRVLDDDADRFVLEEGGSLVYSWRRGAVSKGVEIGVTRAIDLLVPASSLAAPPTSAAHSGRGDPLVSEGIIGLEAIIPARGAWSACVQVSMMNDGKKVTPRYVCGEPVERSTPAERLERWRRHVPVVETEHEPLQVAIAKGVEDLGALRLFDPEFPERTVVAAGAPWFMTLFGRDSILTSWMALIVDPDLALGVLQTLARFQGTKVDPRNDEQPGRILHEMRFGEAATLSLGSGSSYYGSADATPLFVMLLGELRRWGLAREVVDELLPNADRALEWIENFGDEDGDGYVEYRRMTDRGLLNQGWKDSHDGIRYASGAIARAPIALCEVQGYVYAAYLARAYFAAEVGDLETFERYRGRARELRQAFNRDFWMEEQGFFAVGLDPNKRPIDSIASNIGHCLWTGIVDEEKAALVAERLMSPEMFTGWGIRTLASNMGGYNPISYHCGSVWPHDSAIAAAGLARYGYTDHANRIILALLDAATHLGYRLPELFGGMSRDDFPSVVNYPTSCAPQAWAAAAPLLLLRTLLHFDPWVPHGKLWLAPSIPPDQIGRLRVQGIPLNGARVSIEVDGDDVAVEGLPAGIEVAREPRHPSTGL